MAARQFLTHKFWHEQRDQYELVTSRYVLDEAARGDPVLAAERLQALQGVPLLPLESRIPIIANEIMTRAILPEQAKVDALHIGTSAYHEICSLPRDTVSIDVELQAHRQCENTTSHS